MAVTPPTPPGKARRRRGPVGWWQELHPKARQQRLEMFMGILGVFTVIALVMAVIAEVHGEPAVKEVFVLLLFGVPLVLVYRAWQRYDGWGGG